MRIDVRLLTTDALPRHRSRLERRIFALPFGESERERLWRLRNEAALRQSLGARLALLDLIKQRGRASLEIVRSETGKPYFKDGALPAFSISHSEALCAAVLCDRADASVGVDVQLVDDRRHTDRIAERFFSPEEQRECASDTETFFRLWTQKEAEAKRSGIGLSELLATKRTPSSTDLRTLRIRYRGQTYYVSVAASEPITELRVHRNFGMKMMDKR